MDFTAYIGHKLTEKDLNLMCLELNSDNKFIYIKKFVEEIDPSVEKLKLEDRNR